MQTLIVDSAVEARIDQVMAHARDNVFTTEKIKELIQNGGPSVGDDERFACKFSTGHRVVYSLEEQPFGLAHHFSFSANSKMPSPAIVQYIMQLFGVMTPLKDCVVYEEDSSPPSINVIVSVDPNVSLKK